MSNIIKVIDQMRAIPLWIWIALILIVGIISGEIQVTITVGHQL
jgi:hypothetical protein